MLRFEDILDKVESYKPDFDEELLDRAFVFSAREHRGQIRSSGEPYLVHPINVAYILSDMRLDETRFAAPASRISSIPSTSPTSFPTCASTRRRSPSVCFTMFSKTR